MAHEKLIEDMLRTSYKEEALVRELASALEELTQTADMSFTLILKGVIRSILGVCLTIGSQATTNYFGAAE